MKITTALLSVFLMACSSTKDKNVAAPETVTNKSFKLEKPLKGNEVRDYYAGSVQTMNPALDDETMDRMTSDETAKVNRAGDPLLEISLACKQGEFERGFSVASKSFQKYQKIPSYWNLIGNCHLNQGSHRKALLFYNKALEVSAEYVPALNNIGVLYSRQGQDQKALIAFERANKASRFSKTPRYNLARLYLAYGLADEALKLFEGLLESSPGDVGLLNAVASAHVLKGEYQKSFQYYKRIPQNYWSSPEIGLNLSLALKKTGQSEDAAKVFNSLSRSSSESVTRYHATVKKLLGEQG